MKQRLLILAAATAVAFAACNGGNNEGSYSQAQVDSIAKAKEDSIATAMKLQTDSTIAAEAQRNDSLRVADSIANATTKGASATNVKKNSKPTPSKPAPPKEEPKRPKPETVGNGKPKAGNQEATTIGNGKPKAGNQNNTIGNGKPKAGNQDQ